MISCIREKILDVQGDTYLYDQTSYTMSSCSHHIACWWQASKKMKHNLPASRKIFFSTELPGCAYFSEATGNTSPTFYVACQWPQYNPFLEKFLSICKKKKSCNDKRQLEHNVWFQKISIPHQRGNWKFQRGGGGQRLRKFQREGGWTIKITFQGVNFKLSKKTAAYWSDRSFWKT